MNTKQPFSKEQLCLPNIELIESSEQAFSDAFLKAAQILYRHLEHIKLSIEVIKGFTREPFNLASLGLFSKMYRHYHSYVLLEIHQDWVGSQFLIEHLSETAITLTYLLEKVDKSLFSEYISASVHQSHYLLIDVKEQLQKSPHNSDLLILKDRLETFIAKQQKYSAEHLLAVVSEGCLWGPQEANTTAKRGAIMGLNFLNNPARQIALKVKPASWLDLQLSYLDFFAKSSPAKAQTKINFMHLRDASHLCLHATQAFLEEVTSNQNAKVADTEGQEQILNLLYEWFHNAYKAYQLGCWARIQNRNYYDNC